MYAHWEGYSMSKHEVCVCVLNVERWVTGKGIQ